MIQITFTPESLEESAIIAEAMNRIMAAGARQAAATSQSGLITAAQEEAAAPAPKRTRRAPAAETATGPETTSATASAPTEDPKPVAEPSTQEAPAASTASSAAPELSLEDVRAKLTAISKAGKAAEVKGLLADLGVANLTSVPKEAYAKLVADAEAL